jgi:hypothetical protein
MRRFIRFSTALLAFGLLSLPSVLIAQTAQIGTLSGQVKDESGGVLPGVGITAKSQERGFSRNTTTDTNGRFRFPSMPLGRYQVVASFSGFETLTLTDNLVESEKTTDLSIVLRLAGTEAQITVSGEVPIVDKTNTSVNTRVREKEFQKMPVGRSYQALIGSAPGVIGTGNVNAHGALTSNNQFLFDGVDITDPTSGTFGGNLNFEAIQEVSIYTAGVSAEYGRAVGAIVNVITKSGTNRFEGSAKYIATNDDWDAQNKTKNQVTGDSLERVKFDKVNPIWSYTLGGPVWPDHAWFFGAYENAKTISPQRQTVVVPENFQESLESPFWNVRLTGQITPSHTIWGKYHESPTNGFMIDYYAGSRVPVFAAELEAMTRQNQTSDSWAGQWTGVFGTNISAEALYAQNDEAIVVFPFQLSPLNNGAPHESEADGFVYNGASFDGFVKRPREQAAVAGSYFADFGGNSHSFKAGFDWQHLESSNVFAYPGNQYFFDHSFDPATRTFDPFQRFDFDPARASTSQGDIYSVYLRDKFEVGKRLFFEIGARYEKQNGESDTGETTVDAQTIAPRFAGVFDLSGDGKTLVNLTYGRFYQFIVQDFSDDFAQIATQFSGGYDVFVWDGTQYVFDSRVEGAGNALQRNTDLDPTHIDEVTFGFQRQLGNTIGLGVRGIYRKWGDLIDDIRRFPDDTSGPAREFVNYGPAKRKYRGIEFTFDKRFSQNWNASLSYTYSKTDGNHFATTSSALGDFLEGNCTTTVDPTIALVPCREVQDGRNKDGRASYDRPHNVKFGGAYALPLGPVSLTLGLGAQYISGIDYEKQRALTMRNPRTGASSGTTTYFYNDRGSDRLDPIYTLDTSLEATVRLWLVEVGVKGEVFNITDQQEQITVNNVVFCANTSSPSAACTTARNNYGTATARGAFQAPRSYRLTTLLRF